MTALALKARGVERVIVVEKNEQRQERVRSLGLDALGLEDVHVRVLEALEGDLPDVVLECAGNPAAPQLAIELVRSRGVIVLLGVLEEPVEISQLLMMIKEAQMRASFAYRRDEFEEAVELLRAGRLPAEQLITRTVPLEQAEAMFELLSDPGTEQIKILLAPGDT
jgi:threonine dehydrogenase-like Zn-dependent dehydrogenase